MCDIYLSACSDCQVIYKDGIVIWMVMSLLQVYFFKFRMLNSYIALCILFIDTIKTSSLNHVK